MNAGLLLLSTIGLYISAYFTLVYYGIVKADTKYVPAFCRMDEGSCMLIVHHSDAKVFGVPNALLGIAYYSCVLLFSVGVDGGVLLSGLIVSSLVAVILGVYLAYSLFVKLRVKCFLCLSSHGINMTIAFLLLYY